MSYANVHWFRGLADGCKSFDEILERLETAKDRFIKLKEAGCRIKCSYDDYIVVEIPDSAVEEYCKVVDNVSDELFITRD